MMSVAYNWSFKSHKNSQKIKFVFTNAELLCRRFQLNIACEIFSQISTSPFDRIFDFSDWSHNERIRQMLDNLEQSPLD